MAINVIQVIQNEKQKNLKQRAEQCTQAQQVRLHKRRAITSSLVVAFYRKPAARFMAHCVASFLRVGLNTSSTENSNPLEIISRHRDLQAVKKHCSDDRESWPLIDQLLVTEQFDWLCPELRAFLDTLGPSRPHHVNNRHIPPGFRNYLETLNGKELKELCRKTPAARSSGKKSEMVRDLLLFTAY
jgi:hypothetical protein